MSASVDLVEQELSALTHIPINRFQDTSQVVCVVYCGVAVDVTIQVLEYSSTGQASTYGAHFDCHNFWNVSSNDRVLTMLIYLTGLSPTDGGETQFSALGIGVQPIQGRALMFENVGADGLCSALSAHSAVSTAGNSRKVVLQKWVYRDEYKRNGPHAFNAGAKRSPGQITCDEVDCRWYERPVAGAQ